MQTTIAVAAAFFIDAGLEKLFLSPTPQSIEAQRIDSATEIVFLGTSRTQTNINPLLFNMKTANVSETAMSYSIMEPLLTAVLKKATELKLLVIECTAESFAYTYNEMPYRFEKSLAPFGVAMTTGITRGAKSFDDVIGRWFPNIFAYRLTPRQIVADSPFFAKPGSITSGHIPQSRRLDSAQALNILKGSIAMIEGMRKNYGIKQNQKAFEKMLELAKERKIRVALLRHPVHQLYRDEIPMEWEQITQQVIGDAQKNSGFPTLYVIDRSKDFLEKDDVFADLEHLNAQGAEIFSLGLRDELESL